jgi:hypothetical protein
MSHRRPLSLPDEARLHRTKTWATRSDGFQTLQGAIQLPPWSVVSSRSPRKLKVLILKPQSPGDRRSAPRACGFLEPLCHAHRDGSPASKARRSLRTSPISGSSTRSSESPMVMANALWKNAPSPATDGRGIPPHEFRFGPSPPDFNSEQPTEQQERRSALPAGDDDTTTAS